MEGMVVRSTYSSWARVSLICFHKRSHRYAEYRPTALQQRHHLLTIRTFVHLLTVAHNRDILKLFRGTLRQKTDGSRHILQIDARVKQSFRHSKDHHVLERVQPARTGSMRRRDGRFHDLSASQ